MKPLSQNPSNSTPLSEQAWRERIDEALVPVFKYLCEGKTPFYPESLSEFMVGDEAGKKIIDLILSDRKAWGEYVIGNDETWVVHRGRLPDLTPPQNDARNRLRTEQRQRNQGEKTDE